MSPDAPGPAGGSSGTSLGRGSRSHAGSPGRSGRRLAWPEPGLARRAAGDGRDRRRPPGNRTTDIRPSCSTNRSVNVAPVSSRYGAKKRSIVPRLRTRPHRQRARDLPSGTGRLDLIAAAIDPGAPHRVRQDGRGTNEGVPATDRRGERERHPDRSRPGRPGPATRPWPASSLSRGRRRLGHPQLGVELGRPSRSSSPSCHWCRGPGRCSSCP